MSFWVTEIATSLFLSQGENVMKPFRRRAKIKHFLLSFLRSRPSPLLLPSQDASFFALYFDSIARFLPKGGLFAAASRPFPYSAPPPGVFLSRYQANFFHEKAVT